MAQVNAGRVRFVGRGEYNNSTQYYTFDFVNYNGNSYFAKSDTLGNLPTDTTHWQLVAEKGNTGDTGATGNGIASITKTSTSGLVDTYTITYTSGNTTTFNVTNGNGIDHISLTSQSGATKVYTIYFTDGNTTTFTVEDGEVTQEVFDEEIERANMIYNAMPKVSGEGTDLTLNNTAECPVYDIELSPSELEQETTSGKNLFNINTENKTNTGATNTIGNNTARITITTASTYRRTNFLLSDDSSLLGKTITISADFVASGNNDGGIALYFANAQLGANTQIGSRLITSGSSVTITIPDSYPANSSTIILLLYGNASSTSSSIGDYVDYSNVQVEVGDTATSYEPFTYGASPNPQYPQDIHTVSGENTVVVGDKNLFDKDNANILNAYFVNNTIASTSTGRVIYVKCRPNTVYTISKILSARFAVAYTTELPQIDSPIYNYIARNSATDITITTGENAMYLVAFIYSSSADTLTLQEILDSIQIEVSNSATTYVEHQEQNYPLSLGDLEYCKIGDYEDEFYLATESDTGLTAGKWYLKKNVGKIKLGNVDVSKYHINANNIYITIDDAKGQNSVSYSKHFKCVTTITNKYGDMKFGTNNNNLIFYQAFVEFETTENFKTWLTNNDESLYYILATPTYTLLSDTLQTQLDNIQKAITYQDQTNVSQTNADLPFVIKMSAIRDLSGIFELIQE